jgi:hypothetical protein
VALLEYRWENGAKVLPGAWAGLVLDTGRE